jgi:hypothetical protein
MVLSCVVAFIFPFELFLFSYAILGPLHYFTKISWLHDRNYFTKARRARRTWLMLIVLWLGSLALYAYDYVVGMASLYFMSILHVLLEFPLNHQTIAGIGREMIRLRINERGRPLRSLS